MAIAMDGGGVHALAEPLLPGVSTLHRKPKRPDLNMTALYSPPEVPGVDSSSRYTQLAASAQCIPRGRLVAELQIETLSTPCVRILLYSWYAMLLLALLLQSFPSLQWEMRNICGATRESLSHLDRWTSPCVQEYKYPSAVIISSERVTDTYGHSMSMGVLQGCAVRGVFDWKNPSAVGSAASTLGAVQNLRWVGYTHGDLLNAKLNRFVQIVLSMASPQEHLPEGVMEKRYRLMVALEESPLFPSPDGDSSSSSSSSEAASSKDSGVLPPTSVYMYNVTTLCLRADPRCSSVVLPKEVAVTTNRSQIALTIFGVEEELGNVSASSSVGIVFQRSSYTIGTIVWRYIFLFFSALHFIRFLYRKRYSKTLYEQYWVMVLHLSLLLYLDPFFVAGIYGYREAAVYRFFEFHTPNYFAALLSCFIFALVTASINWTEGKEEEKPILVRRSETLKGGVSRSENSGIQPASTSEASVGCQPTTTPLRPLPELENKQHQRWQEDEQDRQSQEQGCQCREELSGTTLSVVPDEVHHHMGVAHQSGMPLWATVTVVGVLVTLLLLDIAQAYLDNWEWGAEATCMGFSCLYIRYTFYSVLLLLVLASCGLLIRLHRNLGNRPYLETRPHQLACRMFIFVFSTALLYIIIQVILIAVMYTKIIGIVAHQPLSELSPLMVSTFFVNYITFVYTTTLASRRVPIRPDNPQWRRVVWSSEWYRWLNLHGGILYIFYNERQECYFNWLQNKKNICIPERKKLNASKGVGIAAKEDNGVRECHDGNANITCPQVGVMPCSPAAGDESDSGHSIDPFGDREGEWSCSDFSSSSSSSSKESKYFHTKSNVMDAVHKSNPSSPKKGRKCDVLKHIEEDERRLIGRSIAFIDRLEDALVDPLQSLLLRGRGRMPFFNLETAIDCLNLSWEAYVTTENREGTAFSAGAADDTSADFGVQRLQQFWRRCTPCCCRDTDCNDNAEDEDEDGNEDRRNDVTAVTVPVATGSSSTFPSPSSPLCGGGVVVALGGEEKKKKDEKDKPEPEPALTMSTEQYGYTKVAVFEGHDVQVVISVMDTNLPCHHRKLPRIVIAFRGTTSLSNALEDLRFRQRTWREVDNKREWGLAPRPKVHSGFLNIWLALKASVIQSLEAYLVAHPEIVYRVFCTGHSLGGALATLCAYSVRRMLRLVKYPLTDVTVYTFGQPPLGNEAFQSAYNKAIPRTFRVVNESDAVALINMYGYHVGIEVDIDRHGNYICQPTYIERLFRPTQGKGFALVNHTLIAYVQSLNAVAERNSDGACRVRCLVPYVRDFSLLPDTEPQSPSSL